jgi:hypothetical protein
VSLAIVLSPNKIALFDLIKLIRRPGYQQIVRIGPASQRFDSWSMPFHPHFHATTCGQIFTFTSWIYSG